MKTTYYPKYNGKSGSIVDALKAVNVDSSLENRKKIAKLNNISDAGTAKANTKMLDLLNKGKLIKSVAKTEVEIFIETCNKIHDLVKAHGKLFTYSYPKAKRTFKELEKAIKAGEKCGTTCVMPSIWAARQIIPNCGTFYVKDGVFKGYSGDLKKHTKKITSGGPIGLTTEQAINKKLLMPGDMIGYKGKTHMIAYSGSGFIMFDGGHAAIKNGVYQGIRVDYRNFYKTSKISVVIRWIDR